MKKIIYFLGWLLFLPLIGVAQNLKTGILEQQLASSAERWNIQHWVTPAGTPVYFIETHALPMVDVQVAFRAGSAYDGRQHGLAKLTSCLLNQGSQSANAEQIAEQWDMAGAVYDANVDRDMAIMSLRSLTYPKQLSQAVATLKEVLAHPAFPIDAFKRIQKQQTQYIQYMSQKPDFLGSKLFYAALYGQHPYGHPVLGELSTVSAFEPEDARKFYQKYYTAQNAVIAMVGDLSLEDAKKISAALSAQLKQGQPAEKLPLVSQNGAHSEHIPFPSNQTHLFMGQLALSKADPDEIPFSVANHILGGGMTSRLFKLVRGEEGLAYHVGSGFLPAQEKGPFYVQLQTENQQKQKATQLVKNILETFLREGPSAEELEAAKRHLIQRFTLELASNQATVGSLVNIGFYGLPLDYLSTYQDKIQAVTHAAVQQALKKHLSLDRFILTTAGKDV